MTPAYQAQSVTGPPRPGDFGLTRGGGVPMALVRRFTKGPYGHLAVCVGEVDAEGRTPVIEATWDGVTARLVGPGEAWYWSTLDLTDEQRQVIADTCRSELGKSYDRFSVFTFIFRRRIAFLLGRSDDHPDRKLFCSEMWVWAAREVAGVAGIFPRIACRDIAPNDLWRLNRGVAWQV